MDTYGTLYNSEDASTLTDTPVYTMADAQKMLTTEADRITRAEQQLQKARQDYDQYVTRNPLTRGDGGDSIREALAARHLPGLQQAEDEAAKVADTVAANAKAVYDQTARPMLTLSDGDMQTVSVRRELVREDCENLPLDKLRDAVRYAVLKDDKPSLYLYAPYLPLRLGMGTKDAEGEWRASGQTAEKAELQRLVWTITDRLQDTTVAPVNAKAADLMTRANKLRGTVSKRQATSKTYAFQSPGEVQW